MRTLKPLISVIIPVFNKASFLPFALDSVRKQTFRDFEVIVVDDASTDNSIECLPQFSSLDILLLRRARPGPGGYAARNLAVTHAKGSWISFLDADDLWMPNHLSVVVESIFMDQGVTFICTGFLEKKYNSVKRIVHYRDTLFSASTFLGLYSKSDIIHTNSMTIRRDDFLKTGGFPEKNVKRGGDHMLWLKLVLLGNPILLLSTITTCYQTEHSGVVSNPQFMQDEHPVVYVVRMALSGELLIPDTWGRVEKIHLKNFANRKTLLWMAQKKRSGILLWTDYKLPFPFVLSPLNILRWFVIVLSPGIVLKVLTRCKGFLTSCAKKLN